MNLFQLRLSCSRVLETLSGYNSICHFLDHLLNSQLGFLAMALGRPSFPEVNTTNAAFTTL